MATMNISLPDDMKSWIDTQTDGNQYGNASEFMRDLIRREQNRRTAIQTLKQLVQEGIDSGAGQFSDFDAIKAEARKTFEPHR